MLDSAAVQSAELRSQYIESAQAEAERLADAPVAMLDVSNDGSDQSSSYRHRHRHPRLSRLLKLRNSDSLLAMMQMAICSWLLASASHCFDLSSRVAPVLTAGKRKRKGRELTSGAD